jgi:hypothetical protein
VLLDHQDEALMLPLRRLVQPHLVAAATASVMAVVPLSAAASTSLDVDTLWNQPDGVSVDSGWYSVQSWWSQLNATVPDDPTQRGLDELAQANADLQNAYNLLQQQRTNPGPHPVPIIDPVISGAYNAITGSNISAPVGSFADWVNQRMLELEGRGSSADIARQLLLDYRVQQAVGLRDVRRNGSAEMEAMTALNTQRDQAFLLKLSAVSPPARELKIVISEANTSTTALAKHAGGESAQGKGTDGKASDGGGKGKKGGDHSSKRGSQKGSP